MKISLLSITLLILVSTSCTRFYMIQEDRRIEEYIQPSLNSWEYLDFQNHIIVHQGNEIFELTNVNYDPTTLLLTGSVNSPIDIPMYYYNKAVSKNSKVGKRKVGDKSSITKQVHLFINQVVMNNNGTCTLNLNDIYKVDISKQATAINALVSIPIIAGAGIGGIAIFLAIACNCPRVYMNDGNSLQLENSIYTGAIAPQLKRDDIKQIPDYFPKANTLRLTLRNEQQENQYTDQLSLISVIHESSTFVAFDNMGVLHQINNLVSPTIALDNDEQSQLNSIRAKDDELAYGFTPKHMTNLSALELSFPSGEATNGTLLIRAKNTQWSGYLYQEFNKLFGDRYQEYVEKNKDKSREDREKWMYQEGITLNVEIKNKNGWEPLSSINLVGDISYENIAVPIRDLPKGTVEIRIQSGYHFWQVDYVGISYGPESHSFIVEEHIPGQAIGTLGQSLTAELRTKDNVVVELNPTMNALDLTFEGLTSNESKMRSLFLKSNGYYTKNESFDGKPQYRRLAKFKLAGELSRFSKETYEVITKQFSLQ